MKKRVSALAGLMLVVLGFTGCPERKENKPADPENKTETVQTQTATETAKVDEAPAKKESEEAEVKTETKVEQVFYVDKYDEIDFENMQIHPLQFFPNENEMYPHGYEKPLIYNIGFSKDGKFAYSISDSDDGRGGYEHTFYIVDLVTDEYVWAKRYIDEEPKLSEVDAAMKKYGIDYVKTKFEKLPLKINGDSFDFTVDRTELKPENEEDSWLTKADFSVTAIKNGKLKKVLGGQKDIYSYDTIVCGVIKNPYENRAAVIIGNKEPIFEGSQYNFYVFGCDLVNNYK